MGTRFDSFSDVIDAFGGPGEFGAAIGIPASHARTMKARNSIPAGRWRRVAAAAAKTGRPGITFELLAALGARDGERRLAAGAS